MATSSSSCKIAVVAALLFALACYGVSAQSPAPASATAPSPAGSGCFTVLVNMSDCLTYVEDGSNLTKPDRGCCPELAGLVDSNPICLCELIGNPDSIGIKIDLNKALKLPSVGGVTTPPVSTCSESTMGKPSTIDAYFKRKANEAPQASNSSTLPSTTQLLDTTELSEQQFKVPRIEEVDISLLEKDPGKRCFIWQYHIDQRDKIRRAYIKDGPYQPTNIIFPASGIGNRRRHFQPSWFKKFPSWLAYSPHKDAAFCLPCYLFNNNHGDPNDGRNAFAGVGFRNWKKVNDGKNCAFLFHEGVGPNSLHKRCLKFCDDLMDQSQHIEKVFDRQRFEIIANNRLRLKASIDAVRWLTFQACAFRGNDESLHSLNRGNFIELIKLLASYNSNVANVVLANALEMLNLSHLLFRKKYCIFLLEGYMLQYVKRLVILNFVLLLMKLGMNQKGKKMAIVLRFVDKDGYVQERFFDLIHVANTSSLTMKKEISGVLSRHCLDIQNLHGQGYDGPSNMPGEWNGFQALLLKDCHYAYYIHCLAHRLQLALVAAAREVCHVHQFFSNLALIVNVVTASPKRHDQLQAAQMTIITNLIASDDIETDSGFNQIGTLQRATDTRWGSQLNSVRSLLCMFDATCEVLQKATKEAVGVLVSLPPSTEDFTSPKEHMIDHGEKRLPLGLWKIARIKQVVLHKFAHGSLEKMKYIDVKTMKQGTSLLT